MHTESHPQAGQTVAVDLKQPIATGYDAGQTVIEEFIIEDWVDVVSGGVSWMYAEGNWAALAYAMRNGFSGGRLPLDDEVLYGHSKASGMGHMVHVSEVRA